MPALSLQNLGAGGSGCTEAWHDYLSRVTGSLKLQWSLRKVLRVTLPLLPQPTALMRISSEVPTCFCSYGPVHSTNDAPVWSLCF